MSRDVLAKLISIRHHCFMRGVLGRDADRIGGDDDFRQAFRTLNRLYVEVRNGSASKGHRDAQKRRVLQHRMAA